MATYDEHVRAIAAAEAKRRAAQTEVDRAEKALAEAVKELFAAERALRDFTREQVGEVLQPETAS